MISYDSVRKNEIQKRITSFETRIDSFIHEPYWCVWGKIASVCKGWWKKEKASTKLNSLTKTNETKWNWSKLNSLITVQWIVSPFPFHSRIYVCSECVIVVSVSSYVPKSMCHFIRKRCGRMNWYQFGRTFNFQLKYFARPTKIWNCQLYSLIKIDRVLAVGQLISIFPIKKKQEQEAW